MSHNNESKNTMILKLSFECRKELFQRELKSLEMCIITTREYLLWSFEEILHLFLSNHFSYIFVTGHLSNKLDKIYSVFLGSCVTI